jgi:hypothetical protein
MENGTQKKLDERLEKLTLQYEPKKQPDPKGHWKRWTEYVKS